MKKYFILFLIALLSFIGWKCNVTTCKKINKQENDMEIIFKRQLGNLQLEFTRTQSDKIQVWKTILTNTKTKKMIELYNDTVSLNSAWEHAKKIRESPDALYNILEAFMDGTNIYIIYDKFGVVELYKYEFMSSDNFKETHKLLETYFVTPAYGSSSSNASFKKIKSSIYILLNLGQAFNTTKKSLLYKTNDDSFIIREIVIDMQTSKSITTISLDSDTRKWMDSVNENDQLSPATQELYNRLKQYSEQKFFYKIIDSNPENQHQEIAYYESEGLFPYDLYKDAKKQNKVEPLLKEILHFINYDTNIHYLGCMEDRQIPAIYFYYKDNMNKTGIIKYSEKDAIWTVCTYSEEDAENSYGKSN